MMSLQDYMRELARLSRLSDSNKSVHVVDIGVLQFESGRVIKQEVYRRIQIGLTYGCYIEELSPEAADVVIRECLEELE